MGNIYSRATRTLIWLGETSVGSSQAWQLVDHIYNVFQRQFPNISVPEEIPNRLYSDSVHHAAGLSAFENAEWQHLRELFEIQWFSRIWIVQEVVLSQQDPVFIHGNITYPWARVERAASWLRRNGYLRLSHITEGLLQVDNIGYLRRAKAEWPLNALMSITQNKFRATDQRDKVYSLLGMAAESIDPATLPEALLPDYTLDVREVYMKAARYFLERTGSLAILTRVRGTPGSLSKNRRQHEFGDWPSWLPDWSDFAVHNRDIRKSFSWIHYGDISRPARLGFPKQYRATGDLALRMHHHPNPAILRLEGLRIDTVTKVLQMSNSTTFVDDFNATFDTVMSRILTLALPLLQDTKFLSWTTHFIKTTTADQHPLSGRTWEQGLKDGYSYLYQLFSEIPTDVSAGLLEWLREAGSDGDATQYAALARNFCYARAFFVTAMGRMGIGPSDSQLGDSVAEIPGGGVPYLLRPNGEAWTFVGEAFVYGVMSGEMVKGGVVMETLDLR
ncbi:hypothetical protein SLS59_004531 [Nothophoma quercina]|uniref:Heterokaryon incompatibility domain-containing protein n=1 Tax=Nothophoma quercina TaxID=749835 RepID=A0ABR3REL1_9PLEO